MEWAACGIMSSLSFDVLIKTLGAGLFGGTLEREDAQCRGGG